MVWTQGSRSTKRRIFDSVRENSLKFDPIHLVEFQSKFVMVRNMLVAGEKTGKAGVRALVKHSHTANWKLGK